MVYKWIHNKYVNVYVFEPEHCSLLDAKLCNLESPTNCNMQGKKIEKLLTWLNKVPFGQRKECRTIPEIPEYLDKITD